MSKHVLQLTKTTENYFSRSFPCGNKPFVYIEHFSLYVAQMTCYLPTLTTMQRIAPQAANLIASISALNQKQILVNACFWFITEMDVLFQKHLAFIFHTSKTFQHVSVTLLMVRDSLVPKCLKTSRKHTAMATVCQWQGIKCSFRSISSNLHKPTVDTSQIRSHIVEIQRSLFKKTSR